MKTYLVCLFEDKSKIRLKYVQEVKEDKIVKMFLLRNGRIVSITVAEKVPPSSLTAAELDVRIKEPQDETFHAPIQKVHPMYFNLKTLDTGRQRILQLKYSGLNKKEIGLALDAFRQLL